MDLSGKVAVVTGSGRGLGLAYATRLASCGAAVVVTSRERARSLVTGPEVLVLGVGEAVSHRHVSSMPSLTTSAAVESGARAQRRSTVDVESAALCPPLNSNGDGNRVFDC